MDFMTTLEITLVTILFILKMAEHLDNCIRKPPTKKEQTKLVGLQ